MDEWRSIFVVCFKHVLLALFEMRKVGGERQKEAVHCIFAQHRIPNQHLLNGIRVSGPSCLQREVLWQLHLHVMLHCTLGKWKWWFWVVLGRSVQIHRAIYPSIGHGKLAATFNSLCMRQQSFPCWSCRSHYPQEGYCACVRSCSCIAEEIQMEKD